MDQVAVSWDLRPCGLVEYILKIAAGGSSKMLVSVPGYNRSKVPWCVNNLSWHLEFQKHML